MEKFNSIAVLIDADNTQIRKLEQLMRELSFYGRIIVKRAYGNWRKDIFKSWVEKIRRLAIREIQQCDYVSGKNATDMALTIDAMDLLYSGKYDAFVIVSSDSDYAPISVKLRESGLYVIGAGTKMAPESFRNCCDEFIFLENIPFDIIPQPPAINPPKPLKPAASAPPIEVTKTLPVIPTIAAQSEETPIAQPASMQPEAVAIAQTVAIQPEEAPIVQPVTIQPEEAPVAQPAEIQTEVAPIVQLVEEQAEALSVTPPATEQLGVSPIYLCVDELHDLLKLAYDKYRIDDGFVNICSAGKFIRTAKPDYKLGAYGYNKLSTLLSSHPDKYDIKKYKGKGNAAITGYKCK